MSIVFVDGQFISVARVDCPKCHGSGIALGDQTYHHGSISMSVTFCNCIKISVVEPRTKP